MVVLMEEEICRVCCVYLVNVSYFDSKIGLLVKIFEEIGEFDNMIVIVIVDYGDMFGECGFWYKMNFFEYFVCVLFVMVGFRIVCGIVSNVCLLVDLLLIFLEVVGVGLEVFGMLVDGCSFMLLVCGEFDLVDVVIGEYCVEMILYLVIMICQGMFKYIYCDVDFFQFYDFGIDFVEIQNWVNDLDYVKVVVGFVR